MKMLPAKKFYFIRHGETDFNRRNQFQGHTDTLINARGREQAMRQSPKVKALNINKVFSSPLSRALETAQILTGHCEIDILDDLKECGCPETAAEIFEDLGLPSPDFSQASITYNETKHEFMTRSVNAVSTALTTTEGTPLIVAHGGTYWALCRFLGHPPNRIPNCTPILFEANSQGWQIGRLS
ncbi:MAG TPA: histidine phosphatase family protein [Phycisphaerales bacterium]|nr:histidine phosphatase family protein [Phycisphaerales bacterium]